MKQIINPQVNSPLNTSLVFITPAPHSVGRNSIAYASSSLCPVRNLCHNAAKPKSALHRHDRIILKLLIPLLLIVLSNYSYGQFSESISTGRPGQAIGAFTVGKGVLQFQQGVDYFSIAGTKYPPNGYLSNNVVRFGILETFEISTLIDYQYLRTESDRSSNTMDGLSNLHFGFRLHINDQSDWLPTTGFQMRFKVPNVSKDFGADNLATEMVFVANWALPENMGIASNWILSHSGNDTDPTGKYVLNFSFPIYNQWSGFVENYGQLYQSEFQTRYDGGIAYLANNNIQLDMSAGYGDNQNIQDYFVSVGISWRILNFRSNEE